MTTCIAVANLKGGQGKSTIAAVLATQLAARDPDDRVLLLDLDHQQSQSSGRWAADDNVDLEVGRQYRCSLGFDLVLAAEPADIPDLSGWDDIVVDCAPGAHNIGVGVGLADVVIVPWVDRAGRVAADELRDAVDGELPVVVVRNKTKGKTGGIRYARALERCQYSKVKQDVVGYLLRKMKREGVRR